MVREIVQDLYKIRGSFSLLSEYIRRNGMAKTFSKTIDYLKPANIISNYLDIIGIFDGSFAYKGPSFMQIDLTNNCNNDCIGCWCNSPLLEEKIMAFNIKQQTLPYEKVLELLDELHSLGTKEVYFAGGGEPFMHPRLMELIAHAKKKNFICYINTNFTLVTPEIIGQLISSGVDHLTVSVWAATPDTYARTHPNKTKGTFQQIYDNLKLLNDRKDKKPIIKIYNVISNLNYQEVEAMVDFAIETKSETMEFTVIDTIPDKTDKLLLTESQNKTLYGRCMNIKKRMQANQINGIKILGFDQFIRRITNEQAGAAEYDQGIIDNIPCYIGWTFARIIADGNVNSCLKSHRFPIGNIYLDDFFKIWNSKLQQEFRAHTLVFKKNDPFFRIIGNDPEARVGCYKSCDDLMRNINTHKKIISLTSVEWRVLQIIAWGAKVKRKFFRKDFWHNWHKLWPRLLLKNRTKILSNYLLKKPIEICQFDDNLKIFWGKEEITKSIGLNLSFKVLNTWFNSSKSKWIIQKVGRKELKLVSRWLYLPITQLWELSMADAGTTINIKIIMEVEEEIDIESGKITLLLSERYNQWFTDSGKGHFPDFTAWQKLNTNDGLGSFVRAVAGDGLPDVKFSFLNEDFRPEVQNSDYATSARVISAAREARYRYPRGRYNLFAGKIKVTNETNQP